MSKKITPQLLEVLRKDINAALQAVAEKHGIEMSAGNATYGADHFTMKLEGKLEGALSKEAKAYDDNRVLFNLPARDTEITLRGQVFTLTGLTPRGKVIIARKTDGKEFTTTVTDVTTSLKLADNAKAS